MNIGCINVNDAIDCHGIKPPSVLSGSLQKVERQDWDWSVSGVPEHIGMYIYVPEFLSDKPPVVVSCHSCGNSANGQVGNNKNILKAADRKGFIVVFPDNSQRNCWDVGSEKSLTHDGGGDTHAIAQMVKYALCAYGGDPEQVFVMGGSSGAMMTQALLAVYPDIFKAGSARAGVPAGCWAVEYSESSRWSGPCGSGMVCKTAQEWGDIARAMYSEYKGPRPKVQLFHGTMDTVVNYKNMAESIKMWTNVLGLETYPTDTDTIETGISKYDREFWKDESGEVALEVWHGIDGSHSMGYEESYILRFFGLDN